MPPLTDLNDPSDIAQQLAAGERAIVLRDEIADLDRIAGLIEMSGGVTVGYEQLIQRYEAELHGMGIWYGNPNAFTGRKGKIEREFTTRVTAAIGTPAPPTQSQVRLAHDLLGAYADLWSVPTAARTKLRDAFLALPPI